MVATKLKKVQEEEGAGIVMLLGRLLMNVIALLVVEYVLPGFALADVQTAVVAAVVLGAINMFLRPILQIIALPITILTLGIVAFLINVGLLMLAASLVPGFEIDSFLTAAVASILLALINTFFHKLAKA
ncbi:hypothetical protein A2801_00585 [Candidatus Woesebacteria bacterium RIFCSPHIGHO2_01_FULL_41_10]|uniref:Phage holin family protein n=1 Tax=Candidatus Woesebacteria bacterium RIFCSPHIGHO2_01_FULL_41_10 TaxID=1802500 RepID=A0A1F7YQT2_9BACT|nr:MAG: hypothetical protein A2801_00585 [Candidatus Woesebacteria bacterium RIFCSPHIGHO2_01_FULL_41_10]